MTDLDEKENLVRRSLHFFYFKSNVYVFSESIKNLELDRQEFRSSTLLGRTGFSDALSLIS